MFHKEIIYSFIASPITIDIVGNLDNKKVFQLSDIASSIRYIILQPTSDAKISIPLSKIPCFPDFFCCNRKKLLLFSITIEKSCIFAKKAMIKRNLSEILKKDLHKNKALILLGARQVGKTTLLQDLSKAWNDTLWLTRF